MFQLLFSLMTLSCEEIVSIDHAFVGVYAVDEKHQVVMTKNADISFIPSSCMKVVTTAAALSILGEEFRFTTDLEYDGIIDGEGILRGNLYVRGGGDPCLGSDRIQGALSWEAQLNKWVEAVESLGIRKIAGKVVIDASCWETALAVPSWSWEDLGNYYGAGASCISFHENMYKLVFNPGKEVGEKAELLRCEPFTPFGILHNEVKTGPIGSGDCASIYGSEFSFHAHVRGTVPKGVKEFTIKGAILDPPQTVAQLFQEALEKRGILAGQSIFTASSKRERFHTTFSPPLKEIIFWTNQKSINLYAEHLLKKMGEVVFHEGSTVAGVKAVIQFWKKEGVNLEGFHMVDGSGLSRKNLITPKTLVEMLMKIKKAPFFSTFLNSLPTYEQEIRAKGGSMSFTKGYVGYAGDRIFAILINQCSKSQLINEKINQFFSLIVSNRSEQDTAL